MKEAAPGCSIELDPRLVEESVLLAAGSLDSAARRRFRRERDSVYLVEDPEVRESRFKQLHGRIFARLDMACRLKEELGEHPALASQPCAVSRCVVLFAVAARDEGADLHEDRSEPRRGTAPPALVIRLRPETLLDGVRLRSLLRRELYHVADMLDPAFDYPPPTGRLETGPRQTLVTQRYRLLWELTIDGRLAASGALPAGVEERRRGELMAAFPTLSEREVSAAFERLFRGPRPRHQELWSFAAQEAGSVPPPSP